MTIAAVLGGALDLARPLWRPAAFATVGHPRLNALLEKYGS